VGRLPSYGATVQGGDFGFFEAFKEAAPAAEYLPESASPDKHEALAAPGRQHADVATSDADDANKFGEFGDFPEEVSKPSDFGGDYPPAASAEVAGWPDDNDGDKFGDFGNFSDSPTLIMNSNKMDLPMLSSWNARGCLRSPRCS
jgi:hypothetical protein